MARTVVDTYCEPLIELSNGSEIDDINFGRTNAVLSYEVFNGFLGGEDGAFANGEARLAEIVQAPSGDANLFLNGFSTGVGQIDPPAVVTREQAFIGRSLYAGCATWAGEIGELILYARALDDAERRDVEDYLTSKWGCCSD